MGYSVIVPTFNEGPNVAALVQRLSAATDLAEILFVDDSTDDTTAEISRVALTSPVPVRVIHREQATGGLGGAVLEGLAAAVSDVCIVMDGDLQHPPEVVPLLIERYESGGADVVVASRYTGGGSAGGLAGVFRMMVSRASTWVTKAMFPRRLQGCSDPMTGFFLVDRRAVDARVLRPRGFKILLEILARHTLRVSEVPFRFADREAGESKASLRQGARFLRQLASLRFGKMPAFALVGAVGAVVNILLVWLLTALGTGYLGAAIIAAEVTIIGNFLVIDRFVFNDLKGRAARFPARFAQSFVFNNAEAAVRIPLVALLVERWHVSAVLATALTLGIAFIVRFVFHALVVYRPRDPAVSAGGIDAVPDPASAGSLPKP
ncbi:glycosyltransferase [Microbacterium istanbulense]|uniref:Glycosyltransferase n=1 Tax=Microbacterium istanbulense TaxID=3122049 RepID=A0ABU8LIG0_9MICO